MWRTITDEYAQDEVSQINSRDESVLKPKPWFSVKTEQKPKPRFWSRSKSLLRLQRLTEDMAHSLNDAVLKFFLTVTGQQTDWPRPVWRCWLHRVWRKTPSHSSWSVDILQWKLFIEVYRLHLSVFTQQDTPVLRRCANTETKNNNNWFLENSQVLNPNGISISWAVIEGLTAVTDWLTMTSVKEFLIFYQFPSFTLGVLGQYTLTETICRSLSTLC